PQFGAHAALSRDRLRPARILRRQEGTSCDDISGSSGRRSPPCWSPPPSRRSSRRRRRRRQRHKPSSARRGPAATRTSLPPTATSSARSNRWRRPPTTTTPSAGRRSTSSSKGRRSCRKGSSGPRRTLRPSRAVRRSRKTECWGVWGAIAGPLKSLGSTAGLHGAAAGLAERTRLGRPRGRLHRGERRALHIKRRTPVAAVDQRADADDVAAARAHALHDFARRAAGGDDVLDDEAALTRCQREPTPQAHHALLTLGEQRADAEGARDLVGDEDAADRGGQHRLSTGGNEGCRERLAEAGRMLGILE